MVVATKAFEDGRPYGSATCEHGVAYSTLKDRVSGHVEHGPDLSRGRECMNSDNFSRNVQLMIWKDKERYNAYSSSCSKRRAILRKNYTWMVESLILSLRRDDSMAHVRMDAINKETVNHYFSLLTDVTSGGATLSRGTVTSVKVAVDGGTVTSGTAVNGGAVIIGGAAVNGGTVGSGAFSGPMSGRTFHNGDPLLGIS